ncbi:MAG: DMT family transporter [Acidimicrobiia bacterium]|nr:DMT family transporter [Acidimicrobiia bacterium]
MAAVLALLSAVVYGAGDFLGGLAARRLPPPAVVLRSNAIGLAGLLVVAPLVAAEHVAGRDLTFGAIGGIAGGVGVLLLYRGLSTGSMSVVAPITGVLSAVVPVAAGLLQGERPSAVSSVGAFLGLVAVALVSRETAVDDVRTSRSSVLNAVAAGFGFGLFFVAIAEADEAAGLWPVVSGRVASVSLFAIAGLVVRRARVGSRAAREGTTPALLVGCGLFDAGANALFLLATHRGLLTLVSVLGALYPAATVLLARIVLHERMNRIQLSGVALAGVAVALVAGG